MAERRELRLDDGRILEIYDGGAPDGTPLIFHFGTPSSGEPYAPFEERAAERDIRLLTYSRAGYGGSTRRPDRSVASIVDDVVAILDSVRAQRTYVAGWSGGGPHALATAALLPDRVIATAVIAGVAPYPADGLDWLDGMGAENIEEFGASLEGPEALRHYLERESAWAREATPEQVADGFGDLVDEVDRASLTGPFAEWMASSLRAALSNGIWGWFDDDRAFVTDWGFEIGRISRPVTVWQGAHDRMVPFAHGKWLAEHVPGARAQLLPEHGHLSMAVDSFGGILDDLRRTPA